MDITVPNCYKGVIPPEKLLQHQLGTLSKGMTACLVEKISTCLFRSRTITQYEIQLIRSQATDMQKAALLIQTVIRKGRKACQHFFKCLGVCQSSLFQTVTGCTEKVTDKEHHHLEDESFTEATETSPPCVINIHNSSLNNCIIGNNNDLCCLLSRTDVTSDNMEHIQRSDQQIITQESTEAPSIQVLSSNIEFVIIGDNNYMNVGSSEDSEQQDYTESEPEYLE